MTAPTLETKRLILRQWKAKDIKAFAKINSDPKVMEFFPSTLTEAESNKLAKRIIKELKEKEYGLWAVEIKNKASFIGFIGLHYHDFEAAFTPCIEIGFRLAFDSWNMGYATEGSIAVLDYSFNTLNLDKIVSFTSEKNERSIALMKKLQMQNDPKDNFEHPKLSRGHPLSKHVLY
nr:hypothetical protein [Candidatus Anoxychlamydiales bacterium]